MGIELYTFQDFERDKIGNVSGAVKTAIKEHKQSALVHIAHDANAYDKQQNITVSRYAKWASNPSDNGGGSNCRLASNFFHRLNTQRCTYLLGNGVQFDDNTIKEKLGIDFDNRIYEATYDALIHGVSFVFFNVDHVHVFKLTEFVPLWDEDTGALMAGIRYWQIDRNKPVMAVLYEIDGYTKLRAEDENAPFKVIEDKKAYRQKLVKAPADDEPEIVGEENYNALPIIAMYGSRLKQSTLVGIRGQIDAYDLIRSGFADDLNDCSEIYWIVSNAGGMDDKDLKQFRERLKRDHIANVQDADEVSVTPYTQEIPYASRQAFLNDLRSQIYEDFGGLDVHTMAAGATNDHIESAYQPLDENADELEYEVIEAVHGILRLIDIEATPTFKRNRISNEMERTNMVLAAAQYLDDETIVELLPFITPDQAEAIAARRGLEDYDRFNNYAEDGGMIG